MSKRSYRFLLQCLGFFLAFSLAYFLAVDRLLVPQHIVPKSYRQFMLASSTGIPNRIIIESGSNATFGIDVGLLEAATRRASFNIADNGGYPLEHKIYRLRKYLRPGDIVILPLEWLHYSYGSELGGMGYIKSLVDRKAPNSFYYNSLPLMSRIQFTFVYLPYSMALKGINYRRKKIFRHSDYMEDQEYDLGELKSKLDSGSRGSLSYSEDMAFHRLTEALSCSTYLFGVYGERFTLSSRFLANLDLLEKVRRETGARIFFAWPTVAAKDDVGCYDEITEKLAVHAAAVQGAVVAKGFEFLGRVGDSRFSAECILNSFYHVKQACAEVRTRRLIEQLEAAGISGESGMSTGEVNGVLLEEWRRLGEKLRTQE